MAKKTLLDNIIESIKGIDEGLDKRDGSIKQAIADLNYKVVEPAKSAANSAVAYANDAIEKSKVNSQAIDDINSAVSDAVSDAAVARSDGLRAWNAAQSNVNLIDLNYASASAAISSARTEALAAADEAKSSASAAQAGVVAVKSDVAVQAKSLSSYAAQASANGADIVTLKSQAGQFEQDIASTKGDVSQLKVSASSASLALSDATGNISSLQATAKSYSAALSDTNSNVASVTATASELETKYADAAGDINTLKANASGFSQTLVSAKGDISTLKSTVSGVQTTLTDAQGNISTLQSDVSGLKKTTSDHTGSIATLQASAKTLTSQMSSAQGDISTLKQTASDFSSKVSGMETSLSDADSKINSITSNGGGRNLLCNSIGKFQPNRSRTDNFGIYDLVGASVYMTQGQQYTVHADASSGLVWSGTHNPNVESNNVVLWLTDITKVSTIISDANTGTRTTFTWNNPSGTYYLRVNTYKSDNSGYAENVMLEKGIVSHDWSPAPEDTDAKITANTTATEQNKQAITLKADQTTVDKTNGAVQQLQSQLKVQADQIASKVSSSDLDAKGYATQTYTQTQIKQTADSWNANITSIKNDLTQSYTNLSATVDGIQAQVYNSDGTSKITQLSNLISTKVSSDDFNSLSKSVNLQTLDSADINNMKTNGHYFVHNLANNPIGGWVYVDVVGNGNDRIRQDVYQDIDNQHCYRRWNSSAWTAWSKGATESEIVQLSDDINLRVKSADLISQINLQAGATLIQSNKLVLDAKTTVFTGDAFIPDAYISTLNADKLMFYGSDGTSATMGASVAQYDDDKTKSTINLQYSGGIEIHSSDQQGSILTMHDNTIRLASKSWGDNSNPYQYSGFYAAPNYSLMNTYHRDGTTSGVAIDDNKIHIYGSSKDQQLGALQADVGWYSINGKTGLLTGDQITLKSASTQATLTDRNINIANTIDTNDKNCDVAIHIKGWAEMTGWFTCMGITQTSLLSTKTRIEPLDTKVALDKIVSANVNTYQFKTDVAKGKTKRHASVIIDDVHDVAEYYTPEEFISENRMGRDDGDIIGYLMGAVQELKKQLDELKEKI